MLCGFHKRCHPPPSHKDCERDGVHVRSHLDQAFFRQEVERHLDDAAANLRKLLFDLLHREAHSGDMAGLDGRLRGIGCGRGYSRASAARTIANRELDSPLYCGRKGQVSSAAALFKVLSTRRTCAHVSTCLEGTTWKMVS